MFAFSWLWKHIYADCWRQGLLATRLEANKQQQNNASRYVDAARVAPEDLSNPFNSRKDILILYPALLLCYRPSAVGKGGQIPTQNSATQYGRPYDLMKNDVTQRK